MAILHKTLFTLRLGNHEFKPGWIPTLVTLCVLYFLFSLGQWQIERAEYKSDLETKIEKRKDLKPIPFDLAPNDKNERLYLPVFTNGTYDRERNILLDNQVVNMRAGYDVYTPLMLNERHAILVNRGWVSQGKTRQELPYIPGIASRVSISGLLAFPQEKGLVLSEQPNTYQKWPSVVQYIDITALEKILGYSLEPMIIILDANESSSFHRKPVKLNMKSEKHMGYAIQWFLMAIVLLGIYFIVNTSKIEQQHD
ncbi:MAG: SURF1 family protein [Gammaproteobacteria bacterium]|nr:SURF1 family protein [Gammaproteobacteria bacterium]